MKLIHFWLILTLIAGINYSSLAQSKKKSPEEVEQMIWQRSHKSEKLFDIPEKYKENSAVVLYQKYYYNYKRTGIKVYNETYIRKRVKILDKASLKRFSEFKLGKEKYGSYTTATILFFDIKKDLGLNYFNVKIIKPNKKVIKVDVEKLKVKTNEDEGAKLAIPNLEVGDIVDFYYYNYESFPVNYNYFIFERVATTFNADYPVLDTDFDLFTEKGFVITYINNNGAPGLKSIPTGKSKFKHYHFNLKNIEPRKAKRWLFPLLEYPSIKMQVTFIKNRYKIKKIDEFIPLDSDKIKTKVTKDDIIRVYSVNDYFKPIKRKKLLKKVNDIKDKKKKLISLYERIRYDFLTAHFENYIGAKNKISNLKYMYDLRDKSLLNNYSLVSALIYFLEENNMDYEVVFFMERPIGNYDNLAFFKSLVPYVKVNFSDGPLYLGDINFYRTAGEYDPLYEGNKNIKLVLDKRFKPVDVKAYKLEVSKSSDNVDQALVEINFDENLKKAGIKSLATYKGLAKYPVQENYLAQKDILDEANKKFNIESLERRYRMKLLKKQIKKLKTAINAYLNEDKASFDKRHKEAIEESYDVKIDNYKFKLISSGRFYDDKVLKFEETYTVKDKLLQKAGNNFVLKLEKIMGNQTNIGKDEMDRVENIYKFYPNNYKRTYKIKIPEAYTVKGVEKLNKNLKNQTGSFVSKATYENNILTLDIDEHHYHVFEPNKNWKDFATIYNEAYDLSQQKILIKKN